MLETPVEVPILATRSWTEEGGSDNSERMGNQQERFEMYNPNIVPQEIGWYLAGFTDGEGSFNVSFRPRADYGSPWKVSLCFNVSQRDSVILSLFKKHLECGTMRQRQDGVWYYEANNLLVIRENVIPFFRRFHFLSAKKKRDFAKFVQLSDLTVLRCWRNDQPAPTRSSNNDRAKFLVG